jgi:hypothetical protein
MASIQGCLGNNNKQFGTFKDENVVFKVTNLSTIKRVRGCLWILQDGKLGFSKTVKRIIS